MGAENIVVVGGLLIGLIYGAVALLSSFCLLSKQSLGVSDLLAADYRVTSLVK